MKRLALLSLASLSGCFFILGFQKPLVCGDGILTEAFGEECDDGNITAANGLESFNDSCEATCTIPKCGDSIQQPFATVDSNGDGLINFSDPLEQCDDGNDINDDGCSNDCQLPICGDGIQQTVPTIDTDLDGVADATEACDDGFTCADFTPCEPNTQCADLSFCQVRGGDGCSQDCLVNEGCGNNIVDVGEECDDGNNIDADGCEADCTNPACENGILDPAELCFDGVINTPTFGSGSIASIELGDLDGDGAIDIVIPKGTTGVDVFFNDGAGGFAAAPVTVTLAAGSAAQIKIGDVDGDDIPDLLLSNGDVFFVKNNGDQSFEPPIQSAQGNFALRFVGNFNGDAANDILTNVNLLQGNNDGTFTPITLTFSPIALGSQNLFSAGDLDGDQDIDLLFATSNNANLLLAINNADGTFTTSQITGANIRSHTLADVDGDDLLDIAFTSNNNLVVLRNLGDGTFDTPVQAGTNILNIAVVTATDFNLDGVAELFVIDDLSAGKDAFVFEAGALLRASVQQFGGIPKLIKYGDINRDGVQDAVFTQNNGVGGVYVFFGAP
jgi:cysteine-rich repeat protein